MSVSPAPEVRHIVAAQRFEAEVDGQLARLEYRRAGDVLHLHHTEVPGPLEGRGIAAAMARAAFAYAEANALRIRPACSYIRAYVARHPETQRLLADGLSS
jgi:predicted GNAT family acetyltransferase